MARPNYSFEKRQRELAKKKKKEEKKLQKAKAKEIDSGVADIDDAAPGTESAESDPVTP